MSDDTIRLHVAMREVPFFNVMDGEWWFLDGAWSVRGDSEEKGPLPNRDAKVFVQIPRGTKTLDAFESEAGARSVAEAEQLESGGA